MNAYDKRQLNLMTEKINLFKESKLDLGFLIQDLESLMNAFESVDIDWKKSFHSEWWTLEQIYAVALDRSDDSVFIENKELLDSSISNIEELIEKHSSRKINRENKQGHA